MARGTRLRHCHRAVPSAVAIALAAILLGSQSLVAAATVRPSAAGTAQHWRLDDSFGVAGRAETFFTSQHNDYAWAFDMATQPDGKIVVAGTLFREPAVAGDHADFAVARYLIDGSLDPDFSDGGRVTISFASFEDAYGVALEEIGGQTKIVVVGHVYADTAPRHRFGIARLNADGTLDTDHDADPAIHLGSDGKKMIIFGTGHAFARDVLIQPDGPIVVAGRLDHAGADDGDFALVRLQPNTGALDAGFGDGGRATLDFSGYDSASSIAVQPSISGEGFRLLVAGSFAGPKGSDYGLTRLLRSGRIDRSFGDQGSVRTPMRDPDVLASYESVNGLAVDAQRRILAVGSARVITDPDHGYVSDIPALVRYTPDGVPDPAFSDDGIVRMGGIPRDGYEREGTDVAVRPSGDVVWTGYRHYAAGGDATRFLVGGLYADGAPDLRFGPGGKRTVSIGPAADESQAVALDDEGRILVAGERDSADPNSVGAAFGIARLSLQERETGDARRAS
jgi:uncharacterized delta-60 repeat protein